MSNTIAQLQSQSQSRRSFLKGAGAAIAAVATTAATSAFAHESSSSDAEDQWDEEFDVVVVGAGLAGCSAAVTIATEGSGESVLLIEKGESGPSGNSAYALGVAHRCEDVDAFETYVTALMGERSTTPQDVIHAYCEGTAENVDWLKSLNPDLDNMYIMDFGAQNVEGVGGEYPELPECNSVAWVGLGCRDELEGAPDDNGSPHTPQFMLAKAQEFDNVTYRTGAALTDLVQDPTTKAITGVVVNGNTRIKANKGVIMALGGFENNPQMLEDYMGEGGARPCVAGGNTGDGITICEKVGAAMWHMHCAGMWMGPRDLENTRFTVSGLEIPTPLEDGIVVSVGGRRFYMDWDGYRANAYDEVGSNYATNVGSRHGQKQFGGEWKPIPLPSKAWFVFDADGLADGAISKGQYKSDDPVADGLCYTADTIEELAEQMDVPADELTRTIEMWNRYCDQGFDEQFYRPADKMMPIATPPYYAQLCIPMFQNTMGGPVRSAKGEILDPDGNPIEGLYSAGEFGSIWGNNYNGGGNISECMVFGRIAARSIIGK